MLTLGFLGCLGQWTGFTVTIYVLYDWNEMEPWTWIVCKYLLSINIFFMLQRLSI